MSIKLSRLVVSGSDAASFLQGQTSADINKLTFIGQDENDHHQGLSAICNRQGRVITLFWAIKIDNETFHLLMPDMLAEKMQKHLSIFIFRSKVKITLDEPNQTDLDTLPKELIIPWITAENSEEYVPQMLSLDLLLAINFRKGCYTGQEIVARMQYLGKHKRRLALISADNAADLTINAKLTDEAGKDAGNVVYVEGSRALVVIRLEHCHSTLKINAPIHIEKIWHEEDTSEEIEEK